MEYWICFKILQCKEKIRKNLETKKNKIWVNLDVFMMVGFNIISTHIFYVKVWKYDIGKYFCIVNYQNLDFNIENSQLIMILIPGAK